MQSCARKNLLDWSSTCDEDKSQHDQNAALETASPDLLPCTESPPHACTHASMRASTRICSTGQAHAMRTIRNMTKTLRSKLHHLTSCPVQRVRHTHARMQACARMAHAHAPM